MKTRIIQDDPSPDRSVNSGATAVPPQERSGPGLVGIVRRHPLITFFVLSYVIGWMFLPWGGFLPFSPFIAALIVVPVVHGRAGMRELGSRIIRWRVGWIWYVVAIGVPLLVNLSTIGLNLGFGAAPITTSQFHPWYGVLMVFGASLVDPTGGPLGEEPGWRGVAIPWLQERWSPLGSAAILALLVAAWHLPLAFIPQFDLSPVDLITTMAVTFWYVWLFNRTGGSVLLTLIAHSSEGSIDLQSLWAAGSADGARLHWVWLLAWSALAAGLVVFDRQTWRPSSAE